MPPDPTESAAAERVLEVAARLFAERGYKAVTLRDIAAEVGIRHTSLYHHAPGGKQELFIRVTERGLARHRDGLDMAIAAAGPAVRDRLYAVADWLLSQPPLDLMRMVQSDMPEIPAEESFRLSNLAYESILGPIGRLIRAAEDDGQIDPQNPGMVAGAVLGMVESLHTVPDFAVLGSREAMAHQMIDMLLHGLLPRPSATP